MDKLLKFLGAVVLVAIVLFFVATFVCLPREVGYELSVHSPDSSIGIRSVGLHRMACVGSVIFDKHSVQDHWNA